MNECLLSYRESITENIAIKKHKLFLSSLNRRSELGVLAHMLKEQGIGKGKKSKSRTKYNVHHHVKIIIRNFR